MREPSGLHAGFPAMLVLLTALSAGTGGVNAQISVDVDTAANGPVHVVLDTAQPSSQQYDHGQLRLRGYRFRTGAWRILMTNTGTPEGLQGSHREVVLSLTFGLPPGWTPRWPVQTGLTLASVDPLTGATSWSLGNTNPHPQISTPPGAQLVTGGLTLYWEFLEPGASDAPEVPSLQAMTRAARLLMIQPQRDAAWPGLADTRRLFSADGDSLTPSSPIVTLGDYVHGWLTMYPSGNAQGIQLLGPVHWVNPRWANHDLDNWHYAIPALCLDEALRRTDPAAFTLGIEMARRLVTVGMCRSDTGPYRGGFWYEKGAWPGIFGQPVPEKAWDASWIAAALLTPDDPLWAEVYELRRDRLLGLDPTIVWPQQYGARRPARVLQNLVDLHAIATPADRAALEAAAQSHLDHVWGVVPVGQHFLHGDAPHGTGSSGPLANTPSVKLFMQLQWPLACARWLARGVGTQYEQRLRDMVAWQIDNWAVDTGTRPSWPYMVSEADPTQRHWIYERSIAAWAQPVLTLASVWFGGHYDRYWLENARWLLPAVGPDPALGLDDRSGGPGRLKTYSARLWALRDPFLPVHP